MIIAGAALLFALLAVIAAAVHGKRYTATTTLIVRGRAFGESIPGSERARSESTTPTPAATEALLTLPLLSQRTAEKLSGSFSADEIAEAIEVELVPGTEIVTIRATNGNPEVAAAIANAYANEAVSLSQNSGRELIRSASDAAGRGPAGIEDAKQRADVARILGKLKGRLHVLEILQMGSLEQIELAFPPGGASFPRLGYVLLFGLLVGLPVGMIVVGVGRTKGRIGDAAELRTEACAPLLASFAEIAPDPSSKDADGELPHDLTEMLLARIRVGGPERDHQVLLVASPGPGEGKSIVSRGLVSAATATGVKATRVEAGRVEALHFLLENLRQDGYELIVVDGRAPSRRGGVEVIPDGIDDALVVGRIGRAEAGRVRELREELTAAEVRQIGVVANFVSPADPQAAPLLRDRSDPTTPAVPS